MQAQKEVSTETVQGRLI